MRRVFKSECFVVAVAFALTSWLNLAVLAQDGETVNPGHSSTGQLNTGQSNDLLQLLLENGEFGAAQDLANSAANETARDEILAAIARTQKQNGMAPQSISTIAKINSDVLRNSVLYQVRDSGDGSDLSGGFGGNNDLGGGPRGGGQGAGGGAAIADFDPLIDLIQNTIDPQSWLDTNGGPGTIEEFRAGVSVDAGGVLRKVEYSTKNGLLNDIRKSALRKTIHADVFKDSSLRKVSLTRLEKECQILAAEGKNPTEVMERLAGIYEIKYLLVYPETGDIVIAGPAGDWKVDVEGTAVNVRTGRPLFRLDDLVVCLRNAMEFDGRFGCSIDPRHANLQATQRFVSTTKLKGKKWRDGLQSALGQQDISVDGIDPQSVVARVIVEADYRMKLVGMDLEKGVPGVESFLSRVKLDRNGNVPPTDVMRLEFVLNYDNISVTDAKDAYQLHGKGVKVVMENEVLNNKGDRIQTGKSVGPAAEFARGFTKHFEDMTQRYPIYAQLKNVFDLAMVTNLIKQQGIDKTCKWNMKFFGPPGKDSFSYTTRKGHIPTEVKSVMNYRELDGRKNGRKVTHLIVGISGGVSVDVGKFLRSEDSIKKDTYGKLALDRKTAKPPSDHWWWD